MNGQSATAAAALVYRLERLTVLSNSDRAALHALPLTIQSLKAHHHLVREGRDVTECCVLIRGYAMRHKISRDGSRQIVSLHMAGDILDLGYILLSRADSNVETLTAAEVGWMPASQLQQLARERPTIAEALWRDTLMDACISREWVRNVGRRGAESRIALMLCEFATRYEAAGLGRRDLFGLPMTQADIGDATGLTAVHVNRMLQAMRSRGLFTQKGRVIEVRDWERLRKLADFDPAYLEITQSNIARANDQTVSRLRNDIL